jgi:mono/diheme cytochrome c family protein
MFYVSGGRADLSDKSGTADKVLQQTPVHPRNIAIVPLGSKWSKQQAASVHNGDVPWACCAECGVAYQAQGHRHCGACHRLGTSGGRARAHSFRKYPDFDSSSQILALRSEIAKQCTDGWFVYTNIGSLYGNVNHEGDPAGPYKQGDRVGVLPDLVMVHFASSGTVCGMDLASQRAAWLAQWCMQCSVLRWLQHASPLLSKIRQSHAHPAVVGPSRPDSYQGSIKICDRFVRCWSW